MMGYNKLLWIGVISTAAMLSVLVILYSPGGYY